MNKNKKIFDKKILLAAILCVGLYTDVANADIITNDKYVKIINEDSYQNITNQQNLLNYGSKWGSSSSQHNSSGWIVDIENTIFQKNTQNGNDHGFIIKGCSTPFVLRNVKIINNKAKGSYPIVDIWKGTADEVADGDAPNHDAIITFINSEVKGNNNHMLFQKNAVVNVIAQNSGSTLFSDNGKDGTFKIISSSSAFTVNFNADSTSEITVNDSIAATGSGSVINVNKSDLTYKGLQLNGSDYEEHTFDITEKNGTYNFNDNVTVGALNIYNGANVKFGNYEHQIEGGSPVTTYGSLNVQNFTNDTNGGILDFRNNHADSNNLGNVNLGSDIKVYLDLISDDMLTASGDTFTSNVNAASNGKIYIDKINFNLPDGKEFKDITGDFKFQILKNTGSGDNLQLALSGDALAIFNDDAQNPVREMIHQGYWESESLRDTLNTETKFTDSYWIYKNKGTADIYGKLGIVSKDTINDSIGLIFDHLENGEIVRYNELKLGDTLALAVQGRTNIEDPIINERSFVAGDAAVDYQLTTDLGGMGGTKLTINGENSYGDNIGIDGGGFKGITVNNGQTLEIKNVGSVTVNPDYTYDVHSSMTNFGSIDIKEGEGTVAYIKAGADLNVENTVFSGMNTSTKWGGVFRIQANSEDKRTIKNSYFINNQALNAAALDLEGSVDIENCYFIDNIGSESNNALGVSQANPGTINIKNSKFVHNINASNVDKDNAAIYINGNNNNTINIENSYIAKNYGGIYINKNTNGSVIGTLKNTVFENNESYDLITWGKVQEISGSVFDNRVVFGSTVDTIKKTDDTHRTIFNGTVEANAAVTKVSGADFNNTVTFKALVETVDDTTFNDAVTFNKGVTTIKNSNVKDTITVNQAIGTIDTSTFDKDVSFVYKIGDIKDSTFKGTFTKNSKDQRINSITGSTFENNVNFDKNYVTTIDNSIFEKNVEFNIDVSTPFISIIDSTFNGTYQSRQGNEVVGTHFNNGAVLFGAKHSTNNFKIKDSYIKDGNLNNSSMLLEAKGTIDIENTEIYNNEGARNNYLIGAWENDTNQKVLIHNGSKINNNSGNVNYLIQNTGTRALMTIMDSEITGNTANTAIITNDKSSVLNLVANNGKQLLLQDNTAPVVENKSVINMNADTSGSIIINDTISGTGTININKSELNYTSLLSNGDSTYNTKVDNDIPIGGEYHFNKTLSDQNINLYNGANVKLGSYTKGGTTTYGILNLIGKTLTNDANGGLIDTRNNHVDNQNLGSTKLASNLNFSLDMNLDALTTDTITANYSNGSGKIILSDIDTALGSKSWNSFTESELGTKIKILTSNSDSLQLGLSNNLESTFEASKKLFNTTEISRESDTIAETTDWGHNLYKTTIVEDEQYGKWNLATSSTENDSLEFKELVERKTRYELMGDTLKLVNQATNFTTKTFTTLNDGDTYNVTENLGATKGTVNVNGISGGNTDTVDLKGYNGFEVGTDATALHFNDVTLQDSTKTPATTTIATVTNTDADIVLNNAILNGNIASNVNYDLTVSGKTTINGTVDKANASMNDTNAELKFNTETFANATMNAQKGTIYTKDGEYKEYNIGKLTSNADARYNIDMNLSKSTQKTDQFVVGNGSTGTVYLTLSSVVVDDDMDPEQSVYIQIIKASGGSGPQLDYDGSLILTQAKAVMSSDYILAKGHGLYTKDTTYDSIMLRGVNDGFKAWVNLSTDDPKEYTFKSDATYTIADTINLDGNNNAEIINNGIVTNNGQLSEFTLTNNGSFTTNAEKIATTDNIITNNGTLTFTGGNNANTVTKTSGTSSKVIFSGTSENNGAITQDNVEITNAGNVTNNALITATSISNEGTLSSFANNLNGAITNDGTLNLTGGTNNNIIKNSDFTKGTVNLSGVTQNNKNITANNINNSGSAFVNSSGVILTGNIKNTGNMTASTNDLHDTDNSIVNDGILTLNGGANTNAITATVATSEVNFNSVISNSATITANQITNTTTGDNVLSNTGNIQATTFTNNGKFINTGAGVINAATNNIGILTSAAEKLNGSVTNSGTLNLFGTLTDKTISGEGTTYVDASLKLNSDANITGTLNGNNGNIIVSSGSITNHNIGALEGTGNYTFDIKYTGSGASIDTLTLTNDTAENAIINVTALNESGLTRPDDFTARVLFGEKANTKLVLSDDVINAFYVAPYTEDKERAVGLTTSTINWNAIYGTEKWTETYKKELSVIGSSTGLLDTLRYETIKTAETAHIFDPKSDNLQIINKYNGTGKENRQMNFDNEENVFEVTENTEITENGNLTINGKANGDTRSTIDYDNTNHYSGFVLDNNNTMLTLKDVEIKNSSALISGSADTDVKIVLDNVNLHDNGTGIQTAGNIEIKGNSTIDDDVLVTNANSEIDIDGSDIVSLNKNLTGTGTSKLNISNGTINIGDNARILALDTILNDTSLNIANESSLDNLNTTFNGTNNLNISNNKIGTLALGDINLNGILRMQIDADLANAQMDKLSATSATIGSDGKIEVSKINLLSPTTQKQLDLLFTNNSNLAGVVNYTGEGQIAYSPIYKYNTSYIRGADGSGHFRFETQGNGYGDFNPSVMASYVTTIITGYQNQMQALHQGFYHMDRYMKYSDKYRFSAENQNKFVSLAPLTGFEINKVPETTQAMWTIPYTTFESVNLKGGVNVNNTAYGMTYGGDSNMFDMGHGFKGVISAFIGYNGNHMTYDGISMTQNGGFFGATFNAYKGNFYTGLTVSTGASSGDADTMYGHDNITLLTAGVANKTGYNFEFLDGKVILQPSLFLGYSWVNTFDYTNAAGVRINQDALNAMQIVPGIKVIGNTKNGWQPYASVDMVWNVFMGRNQVNANDVVLPKLSERAYVQYGVGIQKTWADRFTGFLQAMVRNGGRNGIVLSVGLRWTFGKDNTKTKKTEAKQKTVIK